MKIVSRLSKLTVWLAISATITETAFSQVQVYSFSVPIDGYLPLTITADEPGNQMNPPAGGIELEMETLTETVYYNAAAGLIRQVGSVSVTSPSGQFVLQSSDEAAPYTLTINEILANGALTFDSGFYPIQGAGSTSLTSIPVNGTYSLVTGGQTNTGSFSYALHPSDNSLLAFENFSTSNSPASITLSGGFQNFNGGNGFYSAGQESLTNITASNGVHVDLEAGAYEDGLDYGNWSLTPDSVIAYPAVGPTITNQTPNVTASTGGATTLSVGVSGSPFFNYQWYFDGTNAIPNATNSILSLSNLSVTNIGFYTVGVTNAVGGTNSTPISLSLVDLKMFAGVVINGPVGQNYTVQSMPALDVGSNWVTLTNITLSTSPYVYIDYSSPTNAQQFYRAVPTP